MRRTKSRDRAVASGGRASVHVVVMLLLGVAVGAPRDPQNGPDHDRREEEQGIVVPVAVAAVGERQRGQANCPLRHAPLLTAPAPPRRAPVSPASHLPATRPACHPAARRGTRDGCTGPVALPFSIEDAAPKLNQPTRAGRTPGKRLEDSCSTPL